MLLERAAELEITIARSIADLEALAPEWHQLWQRDSRATPFQSPEWLIPWAKHFTAGEFCCLAVHVGERLTVFLPTFTWENPETGERELLLLGSGISDYCDALSSRGDKSWVSAALEHLRETCEWDVLNFHQVRADSPIFTGQSRAQSAVPILPLPRTIDQLHTVVPKAQLQNLAYYRRRGKKIGDSRWAIADDQSLDAILDELFVLHSARWRERGKRGTLNDEAVRAFHREAARSLLNIGALRLHRLTIGKDTVAVLYAFASHGRTYYYASGFNPEFASVSPGTLIIGHAVEHAVREGCTHFDFLRGAERYKYLWGAKDTQTFRRVESREATVEG